MEQPKPLTLDEIYITPFTARRVYSEDGEIRWKPIERNLTPTGERHVDALLQAYARGEGDPRLLARSMGWSADDLRGFVRVLTGLNLQQLRRAYAFRLADDLLRYTSMTIDEVARRAGFYSASQMCQQFRRFRHQLPTERRKALRQPRDEGRYRL